MAKSGLAKSEFSVVLTQVGCSRFGLIRAPTSHEPDLRDRGSSPAKFRVIKGYAPAKYLVFLANGLCRRWGGLCEIALCEYDLGNSRSFYKPKHRPYN